MNFATVKNTRIEGLDKNALSDPSIGLNTEFLLTSGTGGYCATTAWGCNNRKYHGLLIAPQPAIDAGNHVFVSCLEEQVTVGNNSYALATHHYPFMMQPEGFKNIWEFRRWPTPMWTYRCGDCVITRELMMPDGENSVRVRYAVTEAADKVQFDILPFLAFRHVDGLLKANVSAARKIGEVSNGISVRLFSRYDPLYIQTSSKAEFLAAPDWYYNVEYPVEQRRGYDFKEDLYVPGRFTFTLKKGEKITFHFGLEECNPRGLAVGFSTNAKKLPVPSSTDEMLELAARQFIISDGENTRIKAGFYWFGPWGRDTFISLPGLTLSAGREDVFRSVVQTAVKDLRNGMFPNVGSGENASYNSVDAPLWFAWAIQQYAEYCGDAAKAWADYGSYIKEILHHYKAGTGYNIRMDEDGLIEAGKDDVALTWMDAIVQGTPATPRTGKAVEINALWYNAVCFCIDAATVAGDLAFVREWQSMPEKISRSFNSAFTSKEKPFIADFVNNNVKDWSIRPNQIFAVSLRYSPLPESLRKQVVDTVRNELLTPKGLRTLSSGDFSYKGRCEGSQAVRDAAYHQGTVWPWLLGHFAEACLKECGTDGIAMVREIYDRTGAMLEDQCIGSINEIYNGDEPHYPVGAVAQAWSVAELLRIGKMLKAKEKVLSVELETQE